MVDAMFCDMLLMVVLFLLVAAASTCWRNALRSAAMASEVSPGDALGADGKLTLTKIHHTGIPAEHYYKCDKLKEVEFHPEFYGTIGARAFAETTELKTSITIPKAVTHIYESAFEKSAITGLACVRSRAA